MGRREFLDTLGAQLQGSLSPAEIEGHLHYYNEYIMESIAAGKTEAQVMEELGSPMMIAKTLIGSAGETETQQTKSGFKEQDGYGYQSQESENYYDSMEGQRSGRQRFHTFHISPFVAKWVIPVAIILILVFVFSLIGTVISFVARFFVPIMVIVLVIAIFKSRE